MALVNGSDPGHIYPAAAAAEPNAGQSDITEESQEDLKIAALYQFADEKFVAEFISNVQIIAQDPVKTEKQLDLLKDILDRYQEQPQLVDRFLYKWITSLIDFVKHGVENRDSASEKAAKLSMMALRQIIKLRGYKVVIKYLPHQASDLLQCLALLERTNGSSVDVVDEWEEHYVLLMWLSIAIQVPFDLNKLTEKEDVGTERSVEQRVLRICKRFITVPEKSRDAAAYLLSRFVMRSDVLFRLGQDIIHYLMDTIETAQAENSLKQPHILCGSLLALAEIFKSGSRSQLGGLGDLCLQRLIPADLLSSSSSMERKSLCKAIQRIGLVFLPSRPPAWRYKRGYRSLVENLERQRTGQLDSGDSGALQEADSYMNGFGDGDHEDVDVPEVMDEIIGFLLRGLHDSDGIVRWSAAKGIGRISERLPLSFAEDVQRGVFDLFSYERSESAWHGGCLALAEMCRRGVILPTKFTEVIEPVIKALFYEELRGPTAVGSQVRDAACYVCWSFARAYSAKDLRPFVDRIAKNLVLVALFDRSVNCRRAAAAAFQEHVGRQGSFPRGLDIVPILEFEALGRRSNTYLKICPQIAVFAEHTEIIVDFIVNQRVGYWDASMRELAAETLLLLTANSPDEVSQIALPILFDKVSNLPHLQPPARHGAMIGLGCVLEGLHNASRFDQALSDKVEAILLPIQRMDIFRDFASGMLRQAVLKFISRVSRARLPFTNKMDLMRFMHSQIFACFTARDTKLQDTALTTLESFLEAYGNADMGKKTVKDHTFDLILEHFDLASKTSIDAKLDYYHHAIHRVYILALSTFPAEFLSAHLDVVVEKLVTACPPSNQSGAVWVDCRRACCKALVKIVEIVPISSFNPAQLNNLIEFLSDCLSDYSEDKRGNIGRIVRLAALEAIQTSFLRMIKAGSGNIPMERIDSVIENLIRLFAESIPDIRSHAGQVLVQLSRSQVVPNFRHKVFLADLFKNLRPQYFNWLSGSQTYPFVMEFLSGDETRPIALTGIVSSIGSATESTIRESVQAFRKYCTGLPRESPVLKAVVVDLKEVVRKALKDDRLALPALRTVQQILASGVFYGKLDESDPQVIIDLLEVAQSVRLSQTTPKVVLLMDIHAEALQFGPSVRSWALERILPFLTHVYPRVRVVAATKLHEALMTSDELVPVDAFDDLCSILDETQWAFSSEQSREALGKIATLLHIPVKAMVLKVKPTGSKTATTDVKG